MNEDRFQLLGAVILETVHRIARGNYVGDVDDLLAVVRNEWEGDYSHENLSDALNVLQKLGLAERSSVPATSSFVSINHALAVRGLITGKTNGLSPLRFAPLLREYAKFGGSWLDRMWNSHWSTAPSVALPVEEAATLKEESQIDSHAWTGLPSTFVLTEEKRGAIITALDAAEEALPSFTESQHDRAQARAYIVAAKALLEAPEPEPELVWQVLGRADNIASIAALFIAVIALFK